MDLKVNANGVFANGGHSDIYFRGGNIEINKDNTKGYYALLAECATTTMNMERDENKVPVRAGSAKVTIKGNVGASAGAINVAEPEPYTRVNLGLATPDSSWTGVAYNAFKDEGNDAGGKKFFGEINLWLQNGASWTNEAWGEPPDAYFGEDFSESHLKRLVGGESADKAGHIFQKPGEDEDSEGINIRVDDYKGFTNVYYGHKDEKPTDILGGTFTVTKAQPGSGITLITDSKGLNVDSSKATDKNLASATLNALANKLFYTAYKNGETNLAGKVEIAEGLTSSSLSKRMEDITFKESNGQGQYLYTPASDIPEEQTETAFTDTITGVKAKDMKYVNTGVRKEDGTYKFTKDSEITVAAGGPAVKVEEDVIIRADGKTLKMKTVEGSGTVYGINQSTAKKAEITAKNLDVEVTSTSRAEGIHMANSNAAIRPEMTINGNVNLKVSGTANTLGAYIQGNSRLTVNGNVTADVDGHNGGFSYYGATGLYSTSNMGPNSIDEDAVIQPTKDNYKTGDRVTNVLAAVDAHEENDVIIHAGTHALQLQSAHTIGSPAGIYAGSGKNVTITAGKVNVITAGLPGGNSITNAIWLDAPKTGSGRITIHAPVNIAMTGGLGGNGIAIQKTNRWGESSYEAAASSKIIINGNVNIKGADNTVWGIPVNYENVYSRFNNAGILASVNDSEVQVNGNINFDVYGNGITVNAAGSKVSVGGGQITVPSGMNYGYYTLGAYQGTINVNTGIGGNTPGTADVNLNGDIFVLPTGTVNAAFTTANSRLHGIVDNGGTVNMWLRNGATWTNEARNTRYGEDNEDTGSNGASRITHFYGGNTAAAAGIINQKSDKAITIDHYSGNTTVNFGTLTQNGNGVTISAASANSGITMSGDRSGLGETEAMERLAGKLTYTAYTSGERNLDGTVKLNEGLTARSVARTGRIDFNGATGKGRLGELSKSPLMMKMMAVPSALRTSAVSPAGGLIPTSLPGGVAYILGDRETMMMRGAKSAMTTSMLSWRSGMTDMNQRLGDLRLGASSGMWARTYGGKVKYDKDKTNLSDSFWGAQVGADHKLGSGWHIGGAFDYNDGNAKYDFGGKGDPKLYVGSVYGTKVFDDGQYVDIVGKIGRAENDYTVYNAEGRKLDGDYHATGYGLSVEYGKRFGTAAGYVEPQIQLLFSRLGSADYDAASDFDGDKKMHVHQDSMSSFIGRLGIAAGRATEKGSLYAKASILHEFKGDTAATFSAEGEDTSRVEQDFGDTWAELTLGGVYRLNRSNLFYANVTRGFGGDYKMEWKVNAGLRFAF